MVWLRAAQNFPREARPASDTLPPVQIVGVNKFAIVAHGDFEVSSLHPALFTKTAPKIYHLDWDLTSVQDVILCILPQAGIGTASSP